MGDESRKCKGVTQYNHYFQYRGSMCILRDLRINIGANNEHHYQQNIFNWTDCLVQSIFSHLWSSALHFLTFNSLTYFHFIFRVPFSQKRRLEHIKMKKEASANECTLCHLIFILPQTLAKHVKLLHPEIEKDESTEKFNSETKNSFCSSDCS